jgi:hypothetical protein
MSHTVLESKVMEGKVDFNKASLELDRWPNLKCQSAFADRETLFAEIEIFGKLRLEGICFLSD